MVTVDADILVRPGGLRDLVEEATRMPDSFVQVEGLVLDKLAGTFRYAGNRVYRTNLLPRVAEALALPGTEIRPESMALARLAEVGHPSKTSHVVFGVHDHEQYLRDIYRKSFVQGRKFPLWLTEKLPAWRAAAENDPDFAVCMRGYLDGFAGDGRTRIDALLHAERAARALEDLELVEKGPLPGTEEELDRLGEELLAGLPARVRVNPGTRLWRILEAYDRVGALRMVPYVVGATLVAVGERVRRLGAG
ncbi:MAG: hypothetical protein WEG36_06200 [Gemmatimonadota bacterium]